MSISLAPTAIEQSPWRTIWFSPRITIRRLLDAENRPSWIPVVALTAISSALTAIQLDPEGTISVPGSTMPVIIGVLQLVFGVLIGPFLLAFTGGWLGGEADPADIRQAVAWSYVPTAVSSVLWIPVLLAFGYRAFGTDVSPESGLEWLGMAALLLMTVAYFWSVPLLVATLAEVQRFSFVKAIVSLVILTIPVLLIGALG